MPEAPPRSLSGSLFVMLLLGVALSIIVMIGGAVLALPTHIPINYNEGWNAYAALRAVGLGGGPLYPAPGGLIFNNYPPLSFLIVGELGRFNGDMIVAGRIVALVALFISAFLASVISRRCGATPRGALCAALLPLLYVAAFSHDYVAMDDPQWLGIALMLGGVTIFLGHARNWRLIAAAALMVTAGLVKHNLIAWPLAITMQLGVDAFGSSTDDGRRSARTRLSIWLASASAFVLFAVGVCVAAYGPEFLIALLRHPRVVDPSLALRGMRRTSEILTLALVATTLARRATPLRHRTFAVSAAIFAVASALLQRCGEGVALNAWFEALVALSILTGVALSPPATPSGDARRERSAVVLLLLAIAPFLIGAPVLLPRGVAAIASVGRSSSEWNTFIAKIHDEPGDVACHMNALCYWAGKSNQIDVFNYAEYVRRGGSDAAFRQLLASGRLAMFVLPATFEQPQRRGRPEPEKQGQRKLLQPVLDTFRAADLSPDGQSRLYLAPPP
ncbi:hypothetical protein [Acetobacter sp. DsW_063]|uniref:hypothetical protein n=1 Tax=Acetobacter sp. DsW_063 TaxID=1514894 RepID=UPI000A3B2ED5|nr:hypothetical protein [Acetobacter sp. DsW_063]OUJ14537.1 hypothetical protein HK28_13040 [Acetobacter sp. DsW_063]